MKLFHEMNKCSLLARARAYTSEAVSSFSLRGWRGHRRRRRRGELFAHSFARPQRATAISSGPATGNYPDI